MYQREGLLAVMREPDPYRQVELYAKTLTEMNGRVARLWVVLRSAADVDTEARAADGVVAGRVSIQHRGAYDVLTELATATFPDGGSRFGISTVDGGIARVEASSFHSGRKTPEASRIHR